MNQVSVATQLPTFEDPGLLVAFSRMDAAALDGLPYGVVKMDHKGVVLAYNQEEARLSGLSADRVIGRLFFTAVAPCANVPSVAGQFEAGSLDAFVDYTFSFRTRPVAVRLRLLKAADVQYMVVEVR